MPASLDRPGFSTECLLSWKPLSPGQNRMVGHCLVEFSKYFLGNGYSSENQ